MVASASSTSRIVATKPLPGLLARADVRWAVGGWAFFVLENAVLSENRTALIDRLGDEPYHALYGVCSTVATGSIAYSYYYLTKKRLPAASSLPSFRPSPPRLAAAWSALSLGLCLASQALPKLQVPVNSQLQVRCPFDFATDRLRREEGDGREDPNAPRGLERISRHPGLWSLAFVSAGPALLSAPGSPLAWWWWGPTAVAALGGWHTDSRFRRGMGGTLDPSYDSQTSNIPFAALLLGKQGSVGQALHDLLADLKPLNAGIAVAAATAWVLSRGRVR